MSRNVELHRRALEAYNARDIEAFIAIADPSIEFRGVSSELVGVYHGHEGLRDWAREFDDVWGDAHIQPEAFFDLGDQTLAFYVMRARGAQSGAEVSTPSANVMRWRDGRCVCITAYANRGDALRNLGVATADALKAIAP